MDIEYLDIDIIYILLWVSRFEYGTEYQDSNMVQILNVWIRIQIIH